MKQSITLLIVSFLMLHQAQAGTFSGTVTIDGRGLPGVAITAGAQTSCTDTDASGAYTCTTPDVWAGGMMSPWLKGYDIRGAVLYGAITGKMDFVATAWPSGVSYENSAADFTAFPFGSISKPYLDLSLFVSYRVETRHIGKTLNYYVCAVSDSTIYCLDSQGNWQPWSDTPVVAMTAVARTEYTSVPVLNSRTDVSRYLGTTIYAGYGTDISDVMNNQRYKKVYTIQ